MTPCTLDVLCPSSLSIFSFIFMKSTRTIVDQKPKIKSTNIKNIKRQFNQKKKKRERERKKVKKKKKRGIDKLKKVDNFLEPYK